MNEPALLLTRWTHLLGMMLLFGTLAFMLLVAPRGMDRRGPARLARAGAWLALAAGAAWLVLTAGRIADAETVPGMFGAVWPVVTQTRFGTLVAVRLALLLACAVLPLGARGPVPVLAAVLAGAALASQAMVGHAGAMAGATGALLVASEAAHLLAAGAWLGALPALLLALRTLPEPQGVAAARAFFPLGFGAVAVIAATALVQAAMLVGSLPALLGTGYGRAAVLKLLLFAALAALAVRNQRRLVPAGAGAALARAVGAELALGCMAVLAAAWLASAPPAADETPGWPFGRATTATGDADGHHH